MKFKSVSVITGFQAFLLQSRLIWLTVLYSIFGFMTSMRRVFLLVAYFYFLDIFFIVLFLFEILPHSPIIDSSHWLREDVERIMDKIFIQKLVD